jgi:molybdenum cofactor cytidylyltransferase
VQDIRVPHEAAALSPAITTALDGGADLVLIFGASAIADRRDVIPAGLVAAGGEVAHLGMPVDPGNLLMVGAIGAVPVIGAPGCARSPKENGFDWVLTRLLAGLPVTKADITGMGVGGLLMEIVSRPQPRAADEPDRRRVTALILAAGKSSRMGGPNKLVARLDGKPLVRHAAEAALASHADEVVVVTGHQGERVREALAGLPLRFVDNPRFAEGLSTSLTAGIEALDEDVGAALVLLGDMPLVSTALIDQLIAAHRPEAGAHVVVPVTEGRRGNPVLWGRRFFADLKRVTGDQGGRAILTAHPEAIAEVAVTGQGAFLDLDTPQALAEVGGTLAG